MHVEGHKETQEPMAQCRFESRGIDRIEIVDLVESLNENLKLDDLSSDPSRLYIFIYNSTVKPTC